MNARLGRVMAGLGGILVSVAFFLPWLNAPQTLFTLLQWLTTLLGRDLSDLIRQLSHAIALSGRQLAFDLPWVSIWFKVPILSAFILGILSLAWVLWASISSLSRAGRLVDVILVALGAINAAVLALDGSEISRLGIHFPVVDTLLTRFGLQLAWGYWLSVVGLVLIALGALLGVSGSTSERLMDGDN